MYERRQARWFERTLFEYNLDDEEVNEVIKVLEEYLPSKLIRKKFLFPSLSEFEVVRHFTRLSQQNYGVDQGLYPLGSCTMKYNPRVNEDIASLDGFANLNPLQDPDEVQGLLELLYKLSEYLSKLTGMDYFSLQPAAGAQGELVGVLIMKKYFEVRGENRNEVIVPDTAHGTNPASVKMAGLKVVEVPSNRDGIIDPKIIRETVSDKTLGIMLTNPNTLGVYEDYIGEIADIIHGSDGLLYYDGANLNAILGWIRPGDMGFDITHVNLHKTFSTPHGGGGPGSGPVGVKSFLKDFLPVPIIEEVGGKYVFNWDLKHTIGKVHSFYGNVLIQLRALAYILRNGFEGLREVSGTALLNSNYLYEKLRSFNGVHPYPNNLKPRMHEFVLSVKELKDKYDVRARDIAKRIIDYGVYAPTIYFPTIVEEALMIEPTETASKKELDEFIDIFKMILDEVVNEKDKVLNSPLNTSVRRIDDAYASRPKTMKPTYKWGED
ncbi:TPA: glycine dehydrogenase subunit 2 [Candidatus Geothermarchaeota archaeon]|nr:glycine dehydrogenase subunit 2 [Candidatus Geothermarchaeota archaeon]